ncbi:MAG: hypothetical protein H0W84_15080 [Bacteroidetes bacterium]|nr:hypothetical protein [Bacteroidota bacterium]
MKRYRKLNKDSGVYAYEIGRDNIKVQFNDGSVYLYTNVNTGKKNIEQMKKLATTGKGLTTYINIHVKEKYALKVR